MSKPVTLMSSTVGSLSAKSLKVHKIQRLIEVKITGAQNLSEFDLLLGRSEDFLLSAEKPKPLL